MGIKDLYILWNFLIIPITSYLEVKIESYVFGILKIKTGFVYKKLKGILIGLAIL